MIKTRQFEFFPLGKSIENKVYFSIQFFELRFKKPLEMTTFLAKCVSS